MLEEQDLKAIAKIIAESEERIFRHLDRVEESQVRQKEQLIKQEECLVKMEERLARQEECMTRLEKHVDNLGDRIDNLEKRMDNLEKRMDNLEKRMDNLEKRMDNLEGRMNNLEERMDKLEERLDSHIDLCARKFKEIDQNFKTVGEQIAELKEMDEFILTEVCNVYKNLDERISQIEDRLKEMQSYYRINKLTDENTALLMELYRKLEDRMSKVEQGAIRAL